MAKKPATKTAKKPAKPARARTSAAPKKSAVSPTKAVKYQQSGAPWWKQFLPK